MKLLVDIGNSRVKWALLDANTLTEPASFVRGKTGIKSSLNKAWKSINGITHIFIANVAGDKTASQLSEWAQKNWHITPQFICAEQHRFGVKNGYDEPDKLGIDRWLALIAVHQHASQTQCVIDCGTAITIDIITSTGQHQGGMILPGIETMKKALFDYTDALTREQADTNFKTLATNTAGAIQTGTMYAITAAIERIIDDLKASFQQIRFIITGGCAKQLLPLIGDQVDHYPDLVLTGLTFYARQADKKDTHNKQASDENTHTDQSDTPRQ